MAGDSSISVEKIDKIHKSRGKLKKSNFDKKLMRSVMQNDKQLIDQGKLIKDSINYGINSFNPSMIFEQLVKNYAVAKSIYGESILRMLTKYDPDYIKKNINIPEFQKEIEQNISNTIEGLKDNGFIDKDLEITEKGYGIASLILYVEELDTLVSKGLLGEKIHKKPFLYGDKTDPRNYRKGDRYKSISIRKSIRMAIRRNHKKLEMKDLVVQERRSKGRISIIYGLDASGSMKGEKINIAKKAGVALAYKAIQEKDRVGLIVFGNEIKEAISPTDNFIELVNSITKITASKETNIVKTIEKAIELFPREDSTKHLILLTDALPTVGENPQQETLEAVAIARNSKITISIIGINLNEKGKELAEKIVHISEGKLYLVKDLKEIDSIILEDYYSVV